MKYLISVIIPVHPSHNRANILGACLKSLEGQTYPKDKIELILIGDNCKVAPFFPEEIRATIYNFKKHLGVTKTRNKGIELSNGDLLAFIDADCIAEKDWLENLVKGFKADDIAGCGGNILGTEDRFINKDLIYGENNILPFTSMGNAIFRRKVLEEINFFDEHFSSKAEDVDLCWRVYLKGYRINYIPEAKVTHKSRSNFRKYFLTGVAAWALIRKYKNVFILPSPLRFKNLSENIKYDLKRNSYTSVVIEYSAILSGYIYALLKEKTGQSRIAKQDNTSDSFLQPKTSIKPLAAKFASKTLIKPANIIWWQTEEGYRILNLKGQKQYDLNGSLCKELWEFIISGKTKEIIIDELIDDYEISKADLERDFEDFIKQLYSEKILIKT